MSHIKTTADLLVELEQGVAKLAKQVDELYQPLRSPDKEEAEYCARLFAGLKSLCTEIEEKILDPVKDTHRLYQQVIVPKRLHEMGDAVRKITVKGLGSVSLVDDFHISIIASKKEEAKNWLVENNMGDLIVETVNASSLKAASKKYAEREGQYPDGELFRVYPVEYAKITKR